MHDDLKLSIWQMLEDTFAFDDVNVTDLLKIRWVLYWLFQIIVSNDEIKIYSTRALTYLSH